MKRIVFVVICAVMMISCGKQSQESKRLQTENDSLRLEAARNNAQMDEMLSIMNDIESDFQIIREAENYLTITQDLENSPSAREKIRQNMQLVTETLRKNKEQIRELEAKLKTSNNQSATLRKTIERLKSEVEQKSVMIVSLQEELAKKNMRIQELDEQLIGLNEEMEGMALTNMSQSETLKKQEQEINTAYYCFGTSKELKDQNIVTGGGLFNKAKTLQEDFNRDYFMKVDIRDLKEIPLYAKKAKLLSSHPQESYELRKDNDNNLTLQIKDYKNFWSVGKYLVIEVGL